MSKQLTLSAALSLVAMAAFALFAPPHPAHESGAEAEAAAPTFEAALPTP